MSSTRSTPLETATSAEPANFLGRLLARLRLDSHSYQVLRLLLYISVILLLNASVSFFSVRADLTEQQTYSLAPVSVETVAQLEEPVTIRAYLSSNLPASYNILSSLLRDLLQTYSSSARKGMFSYSVNIINSGDKGEKTQKIQQEAEKYGIYPVQLQGADGNEFKAISAYVGLAISQGDSLEVLSPLQPADNIQYKITAALQKISRKGSALLSLNENLNIYYYFSPQIAELDGGKYAQFPENFRQVMKKEAEQLYGRVDSQVVDPAALPPGLPEPGELGLPETEIPTANGSNQLIYSALVIDNEGQYRGYSLLQVQPTFQLGPEGLTQSNSVNVIDPNNLEGQLADLAIASLGIAQSIGYIADRQTASFNPPNPQIPPQGANLYQLSQEAADLYNFQPVNLDEGIGKDIRVLLLVDPMQQLSDWDLYQIDQFVMRGGRLIVAMQPYQVMQNPYSYGAQIIPNPNLTGVQNEGEDVQNYTLLDLLRHYGIDYQNAMVFDKKSYTQRGQNPQTGGYQETQVYYIPEIATSWGSDISFVKGLKKLFTMRSAPLRSSGDAEKTENTQDKATKSDNASADPKTAPITLLQTSPEAWTDKMDEGGKDLNNVFPPAADKLGQHALIMVTQEPLTSFFQGKNIPEKPKAEKPEESEESDENAEDSEPLSLASVQDAFVEESEYGRVLVSGSSLVFDAQLLNVPTNKALALNLLDYMAGNESMADLRARSGVPNFIREGVSNSFKNFIKWFNVFGLPILVGVLGLLMWLRWRQRQFQLYTLFGSTAPSNEAKNERESV